MAWKIRFVADDEEKSVDIDDLAPEVFESIARSEPGENFWSIRRDPGGSPSRLYAVVVAAAEHLGIEPPDKPETMRAADAMADLFEQVQDVEDKPIIDGFPPTLGAPESGSTSGAPESSDGPETSAESNP